MNSSSKMSFADAVKSKKDLRAPFHQMLKMIKESSESIQVKSVDESSSILTIDLEWDFLTRHLFTMTYNLFQQDWKIAWSKNSSIHIIIPHSEIKNTSILIQAFTLLGKLRYERLKSDQSKIYDYLDSLKIPNKRDEESYDVNIGYYQCEYYKFVTDKETLQWRLHLEPSWYGPSYTCDEILKLDIKVEMQRLHDAEFEYQYGSIDSFEWDT